MHSIMMKSLFRPIRCLYLTSIEINICAWKNNYVFINLNVRPSFLSIVRDLSIHCSFRAVKIWQKSMHFDYITNKTDWLVICYTTQSHHVWLYHMYCSYCIRKRSSSPLWLLIYLILHIIIYYSIYYSIYILIVNIYLMLFQLI